MSATARHRHPDYPKSRCGAQVIVRSDGKLAQRGRVRRMCLHCRKPLKRKDLR